MAKRVEMSEQAFVELVKELVALIVAELHRQSMNVASPGMH